MKFFRAIGIVLLGLGFSLAALVPAHAATVTTFIADNSKYSYTGAIFHAYKDGHIYGKAYTVQPGGKAKRVPANTLRGSLAVYIPARSCARVTKNNWSIKTFCNKTSRGKDVSISTAAYTDVHLYRP